MKQSEGRRAYSKQAFGDLEGRLAKVGHQSQTTCEATPNNC